MPQDQTGLPTLVRLSAIALATLLTGFASARGAVITKDPVLPPQTGAYVGTNGGAGCFTFFSVCANPGTFYDFRPISSTIDASGQQLLFSATLIATVTTLSGLPIGWITFTGDFGETVFGRTSPTETGAWSTQITSLDLSGPLTDPLAGITGEIALDPNHRWAPPADRASIPLRVLSGPPPVLGANHATARTIARHVPSQRHAAPRGLPATARGLMIYF